MSVRSNNFSDSPALTVCGHVAVPQHAHLTLGRRLGSAALPTGSRSRCFIDNNNYYSGNWRPSHLHSSAPSLRSLLESKLPPADLPAHCRDSPCGSRSADLNIYHFIFHTGPYVPTTTAIQIVVFVRHSQYACKPAAAAVPAALQYASFGLFAVLGLTESPPPGPVVLPWSPYLAETGGLWSSGEKVCGPTGRGGEVNRQVQRKERPPELDSRQIRCQRFR